MTNIQSLTVTLASVTLLTSAVATLRAHENDHGQAKATVGSAMVTIDYGRPTLKGRDISKMISPGQMWRIGADVPTTMESSTDLEFGGTRVPKGKHTLLARLNEPGKWSLIVSTQSLRSYGASAKLAEVPLEFQQAKDPVEELTIKLSSDSGHGVIEIAWGTARLKASFNQAQ